MRLHTDFYHVPSPGSAIPLGDVISIWAAVTAPAIPALELALGSHSCSPRHIIASMMMRLQWGRRLRNLNNSLDVACSVAVDLRGVLPAQFNKETGS